MICWRVFRYELIQGQFNFLPELPCQKIFPIQIWFRTCLKNKSVFCCFLIFIRHKSFLWDHCYPCFGLLVRSPLGFKAGVGSLSHDWQRHTCYMYPEFHLWCNTYGNWAILLRVPASRHWCGSKKWDLSCQHCLTVWDQADGLPTELCWLGYLPNER